MIQNSFPAASETSAELHVIRSRRKTLSLEITREGIILVRAPRQASDADIRAFVSRNADWLQKHLQTVRKQQKQAQQYGILTHAELQSLADEALRALPERCRYFAGKIGVNYGRITIRNQKTRWGSCSAKGNLNFNCLLMLAPPEVQDYVVVHELCHRKEMNHSPAFWNEVGKILPDYKIQKKWLKEHGGELMARMIG